MRRAAVRVHLWLGLALGLLWSLQGLTGAALVFHRDIDRWAHPAWTGSPGPMLPLDDLLRAAEAKAGAPIKHVGVVDTRPDILSANYEGPDKRARTLFLDAATGAVVGERLAEPSRPVSGSTSRFLYMLHEHLVAGKTGEIVVGVSGCVLLTSLMTGLWIAWPRRRQWRAVIAVQTWRSRPQQLYGWHRLTGLSFAVVLIAITVGGVYMIFAEPIRSSVDRLVPYEPPYKPAPLSAAAEWTSPQLALRTAQTEFPDADFVRIILPSTKAPVHSVRLRQPGEVRAWAGATTVTVDAVTGETLHVYDAVRAPLANRVLDALFSIHNGEIAGVAGRLLVLLAGLSLPVFYVTGVWLWLARRRRGTIATLHRSTRAEAGASPVHWL